MRCSSTFLVAVFFIILILVGGGPAYPAQYRLLPAEEYYYLPPTAAQVYGSVQQLQPQQQANEGVNYYPYERFFPSRFFGEYRLHGNYSGDSDACATCHAIHTSVGPSLLQWYTVYETCMACHDGTVSSTYNVIEGEIITSKGVLPTYAGAFGQGRERDRSSHNVAGGVKISAAPGGSEEEMGTALVQSGEELRQWGEVLSCTSCHSPHGQGGNARALHPDPNLVQTVDERRERMQLTKQEDGTFAAQAGSGRLVQMIFGYPYRVKIYKGYEREYARELTWADYLPDNSKGYTRIFPAAGLLKPGEHLYASFTPALRVEMDIQHPLTEDELVIHEAGINDFCGACHPDYNTDGEGHSGSEHMVGTYSRAYRHAVGVYYDVNGSSPDGIGDGDHRSQWLKLEDGEITCLTCHLAHGTSREFWERTIGSRRYIGNVNWAGQGAFSGERLRELSGSSALKRLPNMGVCESCHELGFTNIGYWENSGLEEDGGDAYRVSAALAVVGGGYTGGSAENDACLECHEGFRFYKATQHYAAEDMGCEECHGEAGNHLRLPGKDNIVNPGELSLQEQSRLCGRCHADILSRFQRSRHWADAVVSCSSCHAAHTLINVYQLRRPFSSLCIPCHQEAQPFSEHSFGE